MVGYLAAVLVLRVALAVCRFLFAPARAHLRVVPMGDAAAAFWTRWTTVFVAWFAFGWVTIELLRRLGVSAPSARLVAYALGVGLLAIGLRMIWRPTGDTGRGVRLALSGLAVAIWVAGPPTTGSRRPPPPTGSGSRCRSSAGGEGQAGLAAAQQAMSRPEPPPPSEGPAAVSHGHAASASAASSAVAGNVLLSRKMPPRSGPAACPEPVELVLGVDAVGGEPVDALDLGRSGTGLPRTSGSGEALRHFGG